MFPTHIKRIFTTTCIDWRLDQRCELRTESQSNFLKLKYQTEWKQLKILILELLNKLHDLIATQYKEKFVHINVNIFPSYFTHMLTMYIMAKRATSYWVTGLLPSWTGNSFTHIRSEEVSNSVLKHHKPQSVACHTKLKLVDSWDWSKS